jgi:DNA topoisomerase IA
LRRLILAEKFSAARRLAQILSEGTAKKVRADSPSQFTFSIRGDDVIVFPLCGHVVELDYPEAARDWIQTDLDALIDLEPVRQETPPALLVDALAVYGPEVTTPEMTRHLEDRMSDIAEGRATRGEVVAESRHSLHGVLAELRAHQESLGRWVRDATFFEEDYGACDACENGRLVRRRARNGWSFLGCSRFPECRRRHRLGALGQRLPWSEREATAEATAIPSSAA